MLRNRLFFVLKRKKKKYMCNYKSYIKHNADYITFIIKQYIAL